MSGSSDVESKGQAIVQFDHRHRCLAIELIFNAILRGIYAIPTLAILLAGLVFTSAHGQPVPPSTTRAEAEANPLRVQFIDGPAQSVSFVQDGEAGTHAIGALKQPRSLETSPQTAIPIQHDVAQRTAEISVAAPSPTSWSPTANTTVTADAASEVDPSKQAEQPFSEATINRTIERIESSTDLAVDQKTEAIKRYRAALDWLGTSNQATQKIAEYNDAAKRAPSMLEAVQRELATPHQQPQIVVPDNTPLAEVESRANEAQEDFRKAQEVLSEQEQTMARTGDRKVEIAKLISDVKRQREETQQQLAATTPDEQNVPLAEARRVEIQIRQRAYQNQLDLYRAESAKYDAIAELLVAQRDLAKRACNAAEMVATQWTTIVTDFRKRESDRQADEARLQLRNADPALRTLAERNAELAKMRQALADDMADIAEQLTLTTKQVSILDSQLDKAEQRVRRAGHSATVGLMLRRYRSELPGRTDWESRQAKIETEMPRANLAIIQIEEDREALADVHAVVETSTRHAREPLKKEKLQQAAYEIVQSQLKLLDQLDADLNTYLEDLSELEVLNGNLQRQVQASRSFINEHVLWIRSAEPIGKQDFANTGRALISLSKPGQWVALAKHGGVDALQRPLTGVLVILVVVTIIISQSRLRSKVATLCQGKSANSSRFRPTILAVLLSAIIATEWPLLLAYLGWSVSTASHPLGLGRALGTALQYAAVLLWVSDFFLQILRKDGVGESHFGWSTFCTRLLRSELRWIKLLGIPLAVLAVGSSYLQDATWSDSLSRLAFISGMLLLANFMHSILNAKENILQEAILQDTGKWFTRLRASAHWAGVGVPCALAILAAAGFYYSAQQVVLRWQDTMGVALVLLIVYSVAARWCLVKRRNLAMQHARQRQQLLAEQQPAMSSTASNGSPQQSTLAKAAIEDQQPDLSALHEQLRYLLRHAVTVAMLVAMWFIWADVMPALKIFDRVVIWEKMAQVTTTTEDPNGDNSRRTVEVLEVTTLRHALLAMALVGATFVIGRNLPALFEVTVLERLPFDKGGRHAVSVLLKYTVALLGIFLACRTMNITWSSVQWLAAGMTVGLGFGLQEIFANFVSGLILLFERPIRVGDVITLGDVTGTVTNMQIRATTVTNFDRKELIVPNKDLITGRLLNWTLTDTTNRIVITVGIAYQSNPNIARDLILKVVASHENVLADPAPNVTFEAFTDSALNLVVRVYLASMDNRLSTTHDLHANIHAALTEAGIEIAFPQRDINVRGIDQLLNGAVSATHRNAA